MSFYSEWKNSIDDKLSEDKYLLQFLDYSPESLEVLSNGEREKVVEAVKLLLSIPVSHFLDAITHQYSFYPKDVFQYSKLEDATDTLCNILCFEELLLSYEEVGKLLTHSPRQYACIKYGENHAKTAAMLSLVLIGRDPKHKCNMVRISALGRVSTMLSFEDKHELIKRLAIRNPFIKTRIFNAKEQEASYVDTVSTVLSGQTIIRRKHNNEIIMNLILENEAIKDRIRWQ